LFGAGVLNGAADMNFQNDVFISFTHIDNEPISTKYEGWISRFHKTLKTMLTSRLGEEARIWRDDRLKVGDVLTREVLDQLRQSAILLSIVSPRYLKSKWCTDEVEEFRAHASRTGGLLVGNSQRLVPVLKTPVLPLPEFMSDVLFHKFFEEGDRGIREFDQAYGDYHEQRFLELLSSVADALKKMLDAIKGVAPSPTAKPAIYLAECGPDRRRDHDAIAAEWRSLGYPVLPEGELPWKETEYIAAVDEMLSRCVLSIHLVGSAYGNTNGRSGKSTPMHQNERAVARARAGGLKRLIGLPAGTESEFPAQQAFIDALCKDADAQFGADLIAGDIEELKAAIRATLKKIEEPPPRSAAVQASTDQDCKLIYLICNEQDIERETTLRLQRICNQLGFEVHTPSFEGSAVDKGEVHRDLLEACDIVILFYGAGDASWKLSKTLELKKIAGYRHGTPLLSRHVCVAGDSTADKRNLINVATPGLIVAFDSVPDAELAAAVRNALTGGGRPS
jgi:hypothetical protein